MRVPDPFIYGPDGFPVGVKPLPENEPPPVTPPYLRTIPVEDPPPPPTEFQLAQRGTGGGLLVIGGVLLALELLTHGLRTPISVAGLCLSLLGAGFMIESLPKKKPRPFNGQL